MNFKKIMTPICAIISPIILFVILHLALIGPVPVTSIRIDGWNTRTVSQEEINSGLKDFSYNGNYLKSESGDPWVFLDGINENHNMRFLYLDIDVLSEPSAPMQVFLYTDDGLINTGYYNLCQGVNIICLERNDFNQIRLDLTNRYGTYFGINKISFSDNYFLVLPIWFWAIYFLAAAILAVLLILLSKGKLSHSEGDEGESEYWSEWKGFIYESLRVHKTAFIVGSIIVILIFGYEITNFTLGSDEEREIVHGYGTTQSYLYNGNFMVGEGRYSGGLLKNLLSTDGVFTPYVSTLIAVLTIVGAAILNIINFEKCSKKRFKESSCIIFIGLFCSLPYVVTEWMCFSTMNAELSIGLFLMSLSIYTICVQAFSDKKSKYAWLICSSLLCAFAIADSESLAPYFMTCACFCVLFYILHDNQSNFKQLFVKAIPFIVSFFTGFAIYSIVRISFGSNGYTNRYVHWGQESIDVILKNYVAVLDGLFNGKYPGSNLSAISVLCFALMLFLIGIRQKNAQRFFCIAFGGLCCFISSYALIIVLGGSSPLRTMVPFMMLTSAPWIIAIEYLSSYKLVRTIPIVISSVILLYQGVWINKVFFGAHLCAQLDMEMGYKIGTDVEAICSENYHLKPVTIIGQYQHPSPVIKEIDIAGQSVFWWSSARSYFLFRYLGFDFISADNGQIAQAEIYAQDMPVYPQEGYIQEFDDMIVVRLS